MTRGLGRFLGYFLMLLFVKGIRVNGLTPACCNHFFKARISYTVRTFLLLSTFVNKKDRLFAGMFFLLTALKLLLKYVRTFELAG